MPGYLFYLVVSKFVTTMPERVGYAMAHVLGFLRFYQFRSGRRAVDENMKIVLGVRYTPALARRIARSAILNFAKNVVEMFRKPLLGKKFYATRCKVIGARHLETCLKRGRGAITLSPHMGNWEIAISYFAAVGHPVSVIALRHRHPKTTALFVGMRRAGGIETIHTDVAARPALRFLEANGVLGMLGERRTSEEGMRVKFFDREVIFPKGPWWLAAKSGAGVIPSVSLRRPGDRFVIIFASPIFAPEGGGRDEKMLKMAQSFATFVEHFVRRHPEQWATFYPYWGEGPPDLLRAQG
jgi:KDO2-lipid IV(A) lauroyltransferase